MRLLIATDAFPPKCGGSGWSTFYLARALRARGHWIDVVLPRPGGRGVRTRVYDNLPVTEFGYAASNVPGLRAWQRSSSLGTAFAAFLAERAREASLIHAQHLLTIPASVAAGRAANVPVVGTVRDYWPVCLYGTLWRARTGSICPVCHGGELTLCLWQKYGPAARLARPFLPLVEKELERRQRALRESDAVVAVSQFVAGSLGDVVETPKISVVPNTVDIDQIRNSELRIQNPAFAIPSSPYVMFAGKLNELKGADWLGEIMRRANVNVKLIVAGEGPLAAKLAGDPNIESRGWLSNQDMLCLLARARALLFPSRWAEPLARVLLEAQALGTPTVALDTGGTRDIIEHEVNGLLARNLEEFAAQLARLVKDEGLSANLGRTARRTAQERFSANVVAERMEQVYRKAESGKRKAEGRSKAENPGAKRK